MVAARTVENKGAGARDAGPLSAFDSTNSVSAGSQAAVKRLATAAARLALAGYTLTPLEDGSFLVARWNWARPLSDLDAVEQFLKRVSP